jgi:hypothetical protein
MFIGDCLISSKKVTWKLVYLIDRNLGICTPIRGSRAQVTCFRIESSTSNLRELSWYFLSRDTNKSEKVGPVGSGVSSSRDVSNNPWRLENPLS